MTDKVLSDEQVAQGWTIEEGVTCVVAPCCAFTFSIDHPNVLDGTFSCPCCERI